MPSRRSHAFGRSHRGATAAVCHHPSRGGHRSRATARSRRLLRGRFPAWQVNSACERPRRERRDEISRDAEAGAERGWRATASPDGVRGRGVSEIEDGDREALQLAGFEVFSSSVVMTWTRCSAAPTHAWRGFQTTFAPSTDRFLQSCNPAILQFLQFPPTRARCGAAGRSPTASCRAPRTTDDSGSSASCTGRPVSSRSRRSRFFSSDAAAGQDDAAIEDVGRQLRRNALERVVHRLNDRADRLDQRLADLLVVHRDRLRTAFGEVAALHFHRQLLARADTRSRSRS